MSPESRHSAVGAAQEGIGIFLIVSALLYYVVGLRSAADSGRLHQVLSAAHVFGTRVTFPLSSGITTPPALAAVYLAGLAAHRRGFRGSRGLFQLGAAATAVIVLLASNGRAAVAVTLAVVAAALWARPAMVRLAPWVCVFALCMPLVVQTISSSAAPVLSAVVPFFDRGVAGSEANTFGGRTPIWKTAIRVYSQEPPLRKVIGYGAAGHITSGAAPRYVRYLRGFLRHPDQGHPHSTALQVLFDSGALGLGALLLLVFRTLRRLTVLPNGNEHPGSGAARAACVAMLLASACTASTDPLLAPGPSLETFWVFLTVCACAAIVWVPARAPGRGEVSMRAN
jgi:O-antigen ligase